MEPFTALGLAAAVVQFVEFSGKLISTTREIRLSSKGYTEDHETLDQLCSHMVYLIENLDTARLELSDNSDGLTDEEFSLQQLAIKCRGTAVELQTRLKALHRSSSGGKIANLRHALRVTTQSKNAIAGVENRLRDYRQELMTHLTAITTNQQSSVLREMKRLRDVSSSMESTLSAKVDELSEAIKDIQSTSSVSKHAPSQQGLTIRRHLQALSDQPEELSEKLFRLVNDAREVSFQQRALRSLYFRTMSSRQHIIAEAHVETFNWVFGQDDKKASHSSTDIDTVTNFAEWLERGNGIYWVSGKPGSGKSTLMKFLARHSRTADLLSTWARPQQCIIACHYFWSAGTWLQRSIDGLLRTVLYDIFRQAPDLIPKTIPEDTFDSAPIVPDQDHTLGEQQHSWSRAELGRIVDRLCTCDTSVRFCIFIDGLDEYGNTEHGNDGQSDVLRMLARLASSPNFKLCVSSRPWNVFEDAYGSAINRWTLSLQTLTHRDIRDYTRSMLREHPNWREYDEEAGIVVQEITEKAQGVFLWVFLVARSLCEGLTNGDSIATLLRRTRQFPPDLETFFKQILKSIDPFYHSQMAQMFKVALAAEEPMNIMIYSMVDQPPEEGSGVGSPMDRYEIFTRQKKMKRRLNGYCKGFLEVQPDPSTIDYLGHRVGFLHRTVRDFLLTREMADFLDGPTPDFKAKEAIFLAHVALLRAMPLKKEFFEKSHLLPRIINDAFIYACAAEQETDFLEAWPIEELRSVLEDGATLLGTKIPWEPGYFVEFALSKGLSGYLARHRQVGTGMPNVVNGTYLREALAAMTKPSMKEEGITPDLTRIVALLLRRGADPNVSAGKHSIWGYWLTIFSAAMKLNGRDYLWATRQKRTLDLLISHGARVNYVAWSGDAVWGDFVMALLDLDLHDNNSHRRLSDVYLDMLKRLLQAGANPNAPYQNSTVSKSFFASLLDSPSAKSSKVSVEMLAGVAEMLLRHGAHPSCLARTSDLDAVFPPHIAGPIGELWKERRMEVGPDVSSSMLGWLWWPWSWR